MLFRITSRTIPWSIGYSFFIPQISQKTINIFLSYPVKKQNYYFHQAMAKLATSLCMRTDLKHALAAGELAT